MSSLNESTKLESATVAGELQARFEQLDGLPSFPASALQVMSACEDPSVDVKRIVQLIECDASIGTQVLRLANSPLYGVSRPIVSIGQSVVLLGMKTVAQLAVASAAKAVFNEGDPATKACRQKTFMQSLAVGTLARLISQRHGGNPDEAFLGGIMHDIGKLVFFNIVPEQYAKILAQVPTGQTTELETQLLGFAHTEIGKNCGIRWGLPCSITETIADHHHSIESVGQLSKAVIVADRYARVWEAGFGPGEQCPADSATESTFTGVEDLKEQFQDEFEAVAETYRA